MKKYEPIIIPLKQLINLLQIYRGNDALLADLNAVLAMMDRKVDFSKLKELERSLFGMGSITDRAFVPAFKDSPDPIEAKKTCELLCEELRQAIKAETKKEPSL